MRGVRKYRNKPVVVDGERFDSMHEAKRWQELKLLERAGKISLLERQVPYELAPSVKLAGEARARPAIRLVIDFRYFSAEEARIVIEDAKGYETDVSRIKRHLMKSVHGIDVRLS